MSDIAIWLGSLALERYAGEFERAEIDLQTLADLTEDDLKELGLPVGPRRKILTALRARKGTPLVAPGEAVLPRAERRHVTVLFADLVDSTAIASAIDPEAMGELLSVYRRAVSEEIERYGGYVAKFMGDGVMAYFGWPRAQEDAAERSLRAGLGITAAVSATRTPEGARLHTRVGIASGNVVIGDMIGGGSAKEEFIAGDTPNLAARLQAAAQPDQVLISDATHRIVGALFNCQRGGPFLLKGYSDPVTAWHVGCEATELSRFAAVRAARAGVVGRDRELGLLFEGWKRALAGQGSAFVISGDAGIGKSRLVEALSSTGVSAARKICLQCSSFHSTNSLFPMARYIEQSAGLLAGDSPATKRRRLEDLFFGISGSETLVPLVSEMLSLTDASAELTLSRDQRKAALIGGLATWMAELSDRRPTLLVLEDAHWSDATTLDWMTRLMAGVERLHQLIVVTARPDLASPWSGRPHVTQMSLDRLHPGDCERILMAVLPEPLRDNRIIEQIVRKSDGNPLFLEELAMGASAVGGAGQVVPDTLQDALMARLDQLGEGKAVAQRASVLGRRFSGSLLSLISPLAPPALDAELSALVAAEVVYPVARVADRQYEFKHALMRDAAYESLLLVDRRRLHGDVAAALEARFPAIVKNEPEVLAYHFAGAKNAERAAFYHEATGDRAFGRVAHAEAIESFKAALSQIAHFSTLGEKDRAELRVLLKLGTALCVMRGPHHPEAGAAYERAAEIARALGDERSLFQAVWGIWFHFVAGRDLDAVRARAEELVALSERSGDEGHILEAIHCRWSTELFRGENAAAVSDARRGIKLYDPERHHRLAAIFGGHDPGVCANAAGGLCLALSGSPTEGRSLGEQGIALAEALEHPHSIAHALMLTSLGCACTHDAEGTRRYALRLYTIADKFGFLPYAATGSFLSQISSAEAPTRLDAIAADFSYARQATPLPVPLSALMAEQLVEAGRAQEALGVVDAMLAALKVPNVSIYLSELYRLRGIALHALQRKDAEKTALDTAVAIARTQGARLLELRAQCTRLRLGESSAQSDLSAIVTEWPEGEPCADFYDAKSLLAATS